MAPVFPTEIISRIIECAAETDYLDEHYHTYDIHPLPNLCLVSKLFYRLSSAIIYRDVIVPAGWPLEEITKQLVPLLSLEQRCKFRESLESAQLEGFELSGGELVDVVQRLVDQERIVDPTYVKRLIIWDSAFDEETDVYRDHFWRAIDEVMADMTNLHYFHNEIVWGHPPLLEKLSKLQSIRHLGSGRAESPASLQLSLARPLRSITICFKQYTTETAAAWGRILQESSNSLRVLNLWFIVTASGHDGNTIDKILTALLTDQRSGSPIPLPQLEELLLEGLGASSIKILANSIDFSRLLLLQLVGSPATQVGKMLETVGVQLSRLKRLSVLLPPTDIPGLLMQCTGGLEVVHINMKVHNFPVDEILLEVSKHGRTLKAFSIVNERQIQVSDFSKFAHECPLLEDLMISIEILDWSEMALCLMELPRLRNLRLEHYTLMPAGNILHMVPNEGQWFDPENLPSVPEHLDPVDYSLGNLIYNTINCCKDRLVPWRAACSLRYVKLTVRDVYGPLATIYDPRSYELRQGSFTVDQEYGDLYLTVAPVGTEYLFENNGVQVTIRVSASSSRYARDMGNGSVPPVGAWERAFRNAFKASPIEF